MINSKLWGTIGLLQIFMCSLVLFSAPMAFNMQQAFAAGETCANGESAPCAEEQVIIGCSACHSIHITAGNRDGTGRIVAASSGTNRHIIVPRRNDWSSTISQMVGKGAQGNEVAMTAYFNTNYCTDCNGPILSPLMMTGAATTSESPTFSWVTSGNGYGDAAATSVIYYGRDLNDVLLGSSCSDCQKYEDPTLVTNHSVTLTGLVDGKTYYVIHESSSALGTTTYAANQYGGWMSFTTDRDPPVCQASPGNIIVGTRNYIRSFDPSDNSEASADGEAGRSADGRTRSGLVSVNNTTTFALSAHGNLRRYRVFPKGGNLVMDQKIEGVANTVWVGNRFYYPQLAVSQDGVMAYVANPIDGYPSSTELVAVNTDSGDVARFPSVAGNSCQIPSGIAVSADGSKVYLSCYNSYGGKNTQLQVFDTTTNTVIHSAVSSVNLGDPQYFSMYNNLEATPDGRVFLSGGPALVVFDANGTELTTIATGANYTQEMEVSPDGTTLAVGTWQSGVNLIDLATYSVTNVATTMMSVSYSPDGAYLYGVRGDLYGGDYTYKIVDTATNTEVGSVPVESAARVVVNRAPTAGEGFYCPAPSSVAVGTVNYLRKFDPSDDSETWADGEQGRSADGRTRSGLVAASGGDNGSRIFALSALGNLRVYGIDIAGDVAIANQVNGVGTAPRTGNNDYYPQLAASPDGVMAYVANPIAGYPILAELVAVNTNTGGVTRFPSVAGNSCQIPSGIAVSADGSKVYLSCYNSYGGKNTQLQVFDTTTNTVIHSAVSSVNLGDPQYFSMYNNLEAAPDGRVFLSGGPALVVFDANGTELTTIATSAYGTQEMEVSPDGTTLAVGTWQSGVNLIDLATYSVTNVATDMMSVSYSPDGAYLFGVRGYWYGGNSTYRVVDTATNTEVDSISVESATRVVVTPGTLFFRE